MNLFRFILSLVVLLISITSSVLAEPTNLGLLKSQVKFYHDSGEYAADLGKIALEADHYLLMRAEENARREHPRQLALVLDIDETSFSNYSIMLNNDLAATKSILIAQMQDTTQVAILPILSLYNDAIKNG